MPDDYYADSDKPDNAPEPKPEDSKDGQTALANKSAFPGGCKPGDHYDIEIVRELENEVEFKVSEGRGDGEQPEPDAAPPKAGGMESMLSD